MDKIPTLECNVPTFKNGHYHLKGFIAMDSYFFSAPSSLWLQPTILRWRHYDCGIQFRCRHAPSLMFPIELRLEMWHGLHRPSFAISHFTCLPTLCLGSEPHRITCYMPFHSLFTPSGLPFVEALLFSSSPPDIVSKVHSAARFPLLFCVLCSGPASCLSPYRCLP